MALFSACLLLAIFFSEAYGQDVPCSSGQACVNAETNVAFGLGQILCCPPGYGIQVVSFSYNGQNDVPCTCSSNAGGNVLQVAGNGQVITGNPRFNGDNFNATRFAERIRNFGDRLSQSIDDTLRTVTDSIRQSLGNLF